jgi:dimethylamine/trimethylamine dehydrogenase
VVVATGGRATPQGLAKWWPMPVPGSEQPFVIDHERALREAASLGPRVVIFDVVGHIEGPGLAELLARRGLEVTLVSPLPQPLLLDAETLSHALPRACRAGARWCPNAGLAAIGAHELTLVHLLSGTTERIPDVAQVVIRTHGLPEASLYAALRGRVPVVRVGDAVAVRNVDRAVYDGHLAGRGI